MKFKKLKFHLYSYYPFNTKKGFKLIYKRMNSGYSFNDAIKQILAQREMSINSIRYIIDEIEDRYDKERHDYIHALFNNNINN